jgi:hypothetical protein
MRPFVLHSWSEIVMPTQVANKLLAFENFFFVLEGLGKQNLPADVTIGDYKMLGSQYCQLVMPLPPSSHAASLPDPERYCFAAAFAPQSRSPHQAPPLFITHTFIESFSYIYALLSAFQAADTTRLQVTRQISGSSIDWTLGYLIASLSAGGAAPKAAAAWSPLIGILSFFLVLVGAMLLKATYLPPPPPHFSRQHNSLCRPSSRLAATPAVFLQCYLPPPLQTPMLSSQYDYHPPLA